jgi:Outer membrane protein beta-barrel domain
MRALLLFLFMTFVTTTFASVIPFVGALGGISTLSADAGSQTTIQGLKLSSYSPSNGGVLNVFAGAHVKDYISFQGGYIWNQNDLVLNSASSGSNTFYQQARSSSQHAAVLDFLLYFRNRSSWIRPYLGAGIGVVHLSSKAGQLTKVGGTPLLPPAEFSSTRPVFRSHVGADLRITERVAFRYSFSEFIGHNDISKHLSPPAPRRLANFQNLFGFVVRF